MFIIETGEIEQVRDDNISNIFGPRFFFCEEQVLFTGTREFSYRAVERSCIYEIPGSIISDIPIVMWKMLEAYELRGTAQGK